MSSKGVIILVLSIIFMVITMFVFDNNTKAQERKGATNIEKSEREPFMENTQCAKDILEFTGAESIWDVTFIYQPGEFCITKKDDTWYDLLRENKIIMEQKLI